MAIRKPLFIRPLDLGTVSSGNEIAGKPASNLNRHDAIGLTWKSSGTSNLYARGQLAASKTIDFCALVRANAQAGTKYRLRLGASQAAVDTGSVDVSNAANTTVTSKEYGWWTVQKSGGTNGVYDAAAVSATGFSGAFVLAIKPGQLTGLGHIGMNSDPNTNNSNSGIDYGFVINATTATANNNGTNGSATTIGASHYLFLVRSGTTLTLRYGTSEDYTAATTLQTYTSVSSTLYFDCSISTAGNAYDVRLMDTAAMPSYDSGYQTLIAPAITASSGLYHSHLELGSASAATWWRLDISGHSGDFELADLVLGQKTEPSKFYNFDWEYGAEDLGAADIGRFGVIEVTPGIVVRTIAFALAWQTEAEFEASFRPMLEELGRRGIIYCVFDPEATVYRQARTYMGLFGKPPFARGVRKPRTFSQDFLIRSFI
jgi:hypothetical protein